MTGCFKRGERVAITEEASADYPDIACGAEGRVLGYRPAIDAYRVAFAPAATGRITGRIVWLSAVEIEVKGKG